MGIFFYGLCITAILVNDIRQFKQYLIPGRSIPPCKAPVASRNDPWNSSHGILRKPDVIQPFLPALFRPHSQNHMLCRYLGVPCPAVLLAMRTICRKIVEIRPVTYPCYMINLIRQLIRTLKGSSVFQIGTHHQISKQILRCLFFFNSGHIKIPIPMVCKHRFKNFFLFAAYDIDVSLRIAIRIKINILIT